ncbi:hypothetical protein JKP88DRAFT_170521 [Tribonema minus]|uniref:Uncharacterized protein n=1 Tax=Tribonema minus TaxID=303371 RepID=A0A835YLX3_9STRA|nr:hypothetical protein JKP88DRAFT_170521 [Tribonema minus]
MARGLEDVTALFESYHALSNLTAIRHGLKAHLYTGKVTDDLQAKEAAMMRGVDRNPLAYTYEPGGFYDVLKARVKAHFLGCHTRTPPASPLPWEEAPKAAAPPLTPGESVTITRYVKATPAWYAKMAALLAVYIPLYLAMLGVDVLGRGAGLGVGARLAAAFAAGALLQCISFCALHDASHYALWRRAGAAQEALSRCCNAWTLWNHAMWMLHHVYGHHSFTGDPTRDPDLIHARPFIRKSLLSPLHEYFRWFVDWQHVVAPGFMCVIPGQSLGQTISYARGAAQGHVWRVPARDVRGGIRWYEWCVYALSVGSHLWGMNIFVSYAYLMGINTLYHLTIAPDHDTYESAVLNARHPKPSAPQDWGEAQVRNGHGRSRAKSGIQIHASM